MVPTRARPITCPSCQKYWYADMTGELLTRKPWTSSCPFPPTQTVAAKLSRSRPAACVGTGLGHPPGPGSDRRVPAPDRGPVRGVRQHHRAQHGQPPRMNRWSSNPPAAGPAPGPAGSGQRNLSTHQRSTGRHRPGHVPAAPSPVSPRSPPGRRATGGRPFPGYPSRSRPNRPGPATRRRREYRLGSPQDLRCALRVLPSPGGGAEPARRKPSPRGPAGPAAHTPRPGAALRPY